MDTLRKKSLINLIPLAPRCLKKLLRQIAIRYAFHVRNVTLERALLIQYQRLFACDELLGFSQEQPVASGTQSNLMYSSLPPTVSPNMSYPKRMSLEKMPYERPAPDMDGGYHDAKLTIKPLPRTSSTLQTGKCDDADAHTQYPEASFDENGLRSRRGPFKDPYDRAQTAQTRKDNACVRCRMQRIRVNYQSSYQHPKVQKLIFVIQ